MKFLVIIATFICVVTAAYRPFQQQPQQAYRQSYSSGGGAEIPILREASNLNPDGSYSYSYETGNGISVSESGVGGQGAQGSAQWTAPDGTPIQFQYTADENGFQATGSHIPTPPPIPPAILRALEYIRTHPPREDYSRQQAYSSQPAAGFGANAYQSSRYQKGRFF